MTPVPSARRRRVVRGFAALVVLVASGALGTPTVLADHDQEAAERAAREIAATQERADQAAGALFDTAGELEQLAIDIADAEAELADAEARARGVRAGVEALAVQRYVGAGAQPIAVLAGVDDMTDEMSANVYSSIVADVALVDLDTLDQVTDDLDQARQTLEQRRQDAEAAQLRYEQLQQQAEADLVRLVELEEIRQRDAQVEHEVQRLARERAEREAAERAEREAAERAAAEAAASGSGSSGGGSPSGSGSGPGSGGPPEPAAPRGASIVCPIAGPRAFSDTWGAARSGGRSHEGVDMMSPGGTPLVAVESGTVQFKTNRLGGNTIWLNGNSGTNYYYAHLSAWEGSSRPVSQGDVIGYVGATGNTTANHLHLQVHPGGGLSVNPYPYVRAVC
ncbi:MAG TPA: peptidoglycan DD-metalloendopeptidase family protein [Ilumatobacter sp.]|nr:peptidoglycan DD-metalloendopeptidase family protein [Ilumatobacter sp.]